MGLISALIPKPWLGHRKVTFAVVRSILECQHLHLSKNIALSRWKQRNETLNLNHNLLFQSGHMIEIRA